MSARNQCFAVVAATFVALFSNSVFAGCGWHGRARSPSTGRVQEFLIADVAGDLSGQFDGLNEGDLVAQFGPARLYVSYLAGDGNDIALLTLVPEPSTCLMLLAATIAVCRIRRR